MDTEKQIEELTLLLMYLTTWEEKNRYIPEPRLTCWSGYDFNIIKKFESNDLI